MRHTQRQRERWRTPETRAADPPSCHTPKKVGSLESNQQQQLQSETTRRSCGLKMKEQWKMVEKERKKEREKERKKERKKPLIL